MFRIHHVRGLAAVLAAALLPSMAHAAPVAPDKQAKGMAQILLPAQVRKLEDLNFGCLSVTAAGTAVVDPNTDAVSTTGGVQRAGCLAYSALFEAVSPSKNVVLIRIPRNPITVTRSGGTETMQIDSWTLSGDSRRTVAVQEPFQFSVGGTLRVAANQAEGLYTGTFTVEIQYP